MAKREDPEVRRLVVVFLRAHAKMKQSDLSRASGVAQADISRFESGKQVPSEEALRRIAKGVQVPWEHVIHLRRFYAVGLAAGPRRRGIPTADQTSLERTILSSALLALSPYLMELEAGRETPPPPEVARREAREIWTALERFPIRKRRKMIEPSLHASRSWALAEQIWKASERAAPHRPEEAKELADLALWIAARVPGDAPSPPSAPTPKEHEKLS
ncbi:MAG TPA: helix-turn-helix transcriptional regulator [Thermoanaerobaculia bacterium]|nr:helix-turn-helix transcriptional regulator [Thermoanaerobaculia bacterium]